MMDPMEGVQRMYDHSDNLGLNGFLNSMTNVTLLLPISSSSKFWKIAVLFTLRPMKNMLI